MSLNTDSAIQEYFASEKEAGVDAFETVFASDAAVIDEGKTHSGIEAIKAWKQNAKQKYPSRSVIQMLADKWTLLVIDSLSSGPIRSGELRRHVGGVTQKMLTQTLRLLERDGLVLRVVYPSSPPSVEYSLTPLGVSITAVTAQMCQWAEDNMKPVLVARLDYDTRVASDEQATASTTSARSVRREFT
ncbi:helix-turn-helix domain-containing protein [Pseudomonas syringae group genomosp. 3]|nr:helix-turn-helix domain-containing protein [Pseudomonas syringae group genomosp. 3]